MKILDGVVARLVVAMVVCAGVAGCASTGGTSGGAEVGEQKAIAETGSDGEHGEEKAIAHAVSEADVAATHSKEPLKSQAATLYVNGLGCPLCATNIDMQLNRVKGIASTKVDLSTGKVDLAFVGPDRPSPQRLADAVADAGFTLVKIETR